MGEARGEANGTLHLLNRRCAPLTDATSARIQALPLEQLEDLADALLDFQCTTRPGQLARSAQLTPLLQPRPHNLHGLELGGCCQRHGHKATMVSA